MGMDAGLIILTSPAIAGTTDGAWATSADHLDTTGDKVFIVAPVSMQVVEIGVLVTVATGADTLAFKVSTAPVTGGSYTDLATCTGPSATSMVAGKRLKKSVDITVAVGDVIRFNVTDACASGGHGIFYCLAYPSGDQKQAADDYLSTT